MDGILKYLSETYFTCTLNLLVAFLLGVVGIRYRTKHPIIKNFAYYGWASFMQIILYSVLYSYNIENKALYKKISINVFILIEFIVVYQFLIQAIRYSKIKTFMLLLLPLFIIYIILLHVKDTSFELTEVYILEAILIIVPCCIYFFQLFESSRIEDLKNTPEFWVNAGLLFYFGLTLPLFAFDNWLREHRILKSTGLYAINYISYSVLYMLIIKGYLCNAKKST
jgi:hypothetical protein